MHLQKKKIDISLYVPATLFIGVITCGVIVAMKTSLSRCKDEKHL